MRMLAAIAAIAITLGIDAPRPAQAARWAPWCAWFTGRDYSYDCSYYTLEQCSVTVRGVGGYCAPNAYPQPLPYPPRRPRK